MSLIFIKCKTLSNPPLLTLNFLPTAPTRATHTTPCQTLETKNSMQSIRWGKYQVGKVSGMQSIRWGKKYQVGKGLEKFQFPSESKLTLVSVKSSTAFLTLSRNLQVIIIIEPETFEKIEQALAEKEPGVTFVGRLASYKYFNMDQVFNIEENFLLKKLEHGSDVQLVKLFGCQDYYLMCVLQAILNALELFDGLVGSGKLKRKKR